MKNNTPVADQNNVLSAFARAVAREVHVLIRQPDLLWQHSSNFE
jgi:hypothetical protein